MAFEWDEKKASANLKKHGTLFSYATRVFLDDGRIEWLDDREEYREDRFVTVGLVDGREIAVVLYMAGGQYPVDLRQKG